jgi:hypothetical protein
LSQPNLPHVLEYHFQFRPHRCKRDEYKCTTAVRSHAVTTSNDQRFS